MTAPPLTTTEIHVAYPWAWTWVLPHTIPVHEDPDVTDGIHHYPGPAPDWQLVKQAVIDAVTHAQRTPLTVDALLRTYTPVTLTYSLDAGTRAVVKSWLGAGTPVNWSPTDDQIGDGRHRLWATMRLSTSMALPIMTTDLGMGTIHEALIQFEGEEKRRRMAEVVEAQLRESRELFTTVGFEHQNKIAVEHIDEALALLDRYQTAPAMTESEFRARAE